MSACALAMLLLDASASILPPDGQLQTQGHAAAFEDHVVNRAIARGDGISEMIGWRILHDELDAAAFAASLLEAARGIPSGTNLGGALLVAMDRLDAAPCEADQRVIDLVTDGEADARRAQEARARPGDWLRENAVTSGGFVMEAPDWSSLAVAIRRKVTLELAGDP